MKVRFEPPAELVKLRLGKVLCVELLDGELNKSEGSVLMCRPIAVQSENLRYNLLHRAETHMRSSSLKDDLVEQFEALKTRLVNETNLPSLVKQKPVQDIKTYMRLVAKQLRFLSWKTRSGTSAYP